MANIFIVHWNKDEINELAQPLVKAKHVVRKHWSQEETADLKELPDVLVISLERLPSHGKAIAEWMWEAKKRQHIPIVFVGGKPEKVQPLKSRFPKATFCSPARLAKIVGTLTRT